MAAARRLSAIMFTDMVDFTARTQSDESGTLRLLTELQGRVDPLLEAHHGRVVKSTGDGLLVEFPSALEAAQCAVAIQRAIHDRNRTPGSSPVELRIGIHLGDVEQRGSDIFGDAVNIASRVQPTAEPGGIAVSQQVYDQVRNKLGLPLEPLGQRPLKGVAVPMELYRIVLPWNGAEEPAGPAAANRIAVLPFANISPDPKDAYFSDGLTEEIITVLSQIGELRVIARTSVEPYRNAPKSVAQVRSDLGVAWVLEGSVRKTGTRLRITVQLIDARSQEHLWAHSYDHELDDVFSVQAEMARQVAEALKIKLVAPERSRLEHRPAPRPESYLAYLQGRSHLRGVTEPELELAQREFERAIALDDRNAAAHAALADVHTIRGGLYRHLSRPEVRRLVEHHAARALELDPDLAEAHTSLAFRYYDDDRWAEAEEEFRRAIALNPSYAWAHQWYADLLADLGRLDEALGELALAEEIDPLSSLILASEIALLVWSGRLEDAEARRDRLKSLERVGWLFWDVEATLAIARGNTARFLESIEQLDRAMPGRAEIRVGYAFYDAMEGRGEEARAKLRSVEGLEEPIRPDNQIARAYVLLGDLDATFHWLDIATSAHRLTPRIWRYDPIVAPVRADPRFREILRRLRLD